jgi:hypothetical protein
VLAILGIAVSAAEDRTPAIDPLQRLKDRSGSIRWNEIRERVAAPESVKIEVPMPALERPGLPPITKTIFDQIDSPFGEPESLSDESREGLAARDEAVAEIDQERAVPMREFLAPSPAPAPFPAGSALELVAEESVVGPGVPLSDRPAAEIFGDAPVVQIAQNLPDPIPAADPTPVPAKEPKVVEGPEDLPELRPLKDINPYFDYFPIGSELYAAGGGTKIPNEKELPKEGSLSRAFGGTDFMWTASNLYHNPLYFEDPELERYGHDHGFMQPAYSIGKFGLQFVGLPYQMALDPPCRHEYALGWARPQEICTPRKKSRIPFNAKAAATAAGAYTGLIFIFP